MPPPFDFLCPVICDAFDNKETDREPEEEEEEESSTDRANCDRLTIVTRPFDAFEDRSEEYVRAVAELTEYYDSDPQCRTKWQVDDYVYTDSFLAPAALFGGPDDVETRYLNWVHFSLNGTAENVDQKWVGFRFDWEGFSWIYLLVGKADPALELSCNSPRVDWSVFPEGESDYMGYHGAFAVAAVKPYVVYDVLLQEVLPGGRMGLRIRYWAGVMNNFSFYAPSDVDYARRAEGLRVDDLPEECWDTAARDVTSEGTLAQWWMTLICSTTSGLVWRDDRIGSTGVAVTYYCDPLRNPLPSATEIFPDDSYVDERGLATDRGFSDPLARMSGEAYDCSLLGVVVSAEVCFVLEPKEWASTDAATLAKEGFRAVFGSRIRASFEIQFVGPDPEQDQASRQPLYGETYPHRVRRWFCLKPRDLETVDDLAREMEILRGTGEGRWTFREWDYTRIQTVRDFARGSASTCCR